jgi:hypothetical protein
LVHATGEAAAEAVRLLSSQLAALEVVLAGQAEEARTLRDMRQVCVLRRA